MLFNNDFGFFVIGFDLLFSFGLFLFEDMSSIWSVDELSYIFIL